MHMKNFSDQSANNTFVLLLLSLLCVVDISMLADAIMLPSEVSVHGLVDKQSLCTNETKFLIIFYLLGHH